MVLQGLNLTMCIAFWLKIRHHMQSLFIQFFLGLSHVQKFGESAVTRYLACPFTASDNPQSCFQNNRIRIKVWLNMDIVIYVMFTQDT